MSLTLRVKAGVATFSWDEGPMKASWELKTGDSEEDIMNVLASLARFVKGQPAPAQVIDLPLHVVPDPVDQAYMRGYNSVQPSPAPPGVMTWAPAVKPVPLEDSLNAAGQNGFELIPPEELED